MKRYPPSLAGLFAAIALSIPTLGPGTARGQTPASATPTSAGPVTIISATQAAALAAMELSLEGQNNAVTAARTALNRSTFSERSDPEDIRAKVSALGEAEQVLALARADAFRKLQATSHRLGPGQVQTLIAQTGRGGRGGGGAGRGGPEPVDFEDHAGFVSIFDGTLNDWDGDPAVWHIVDGAIAADTVATPGATFIFWKGGNVGDFELKLRVKLVGAGSGIMYRSIRQPSIGNPWNVYGYQYDLGATNAGQLVDQGGRNVVSPVGDIDQLRDGRRIMIASVNEPPAINWYLPGEWNDVHIIARGGTLIHILNGHIMTVTVDDDSALRTPEGVIALQAEGSGQIYFKDIWLKKL